MTNATQKTLATIETSLNARIATAKSRARVASNVKALESAKTSLARETSADFFVTYASAFNLDSLKYEENKDADNKLDFVAHKTLAKLSSIVACVTQNNFSLLDAYVHDFLVSVFESEKKVANNDQRAIFCHKLERLNSDVARADKTRADSTAATQTSQIRRLFEKLNLCTYDRKAKTLDMKVSTKLYKALKKAYETRNK